VADTPNPKSPLALAIEEDKPKAYPFNVQGVFGLGERPIHKVSVSAPRKAQDENALKDAHFRIDKFAEGNQALKDDEDLLNDAKAMAIIQRAVRTEGGVMEAFPGVGWMREEMTGPQIGQLLNLVNEVRRRESGIQWGFTAERVESIIQLCVRAANSDIPERVLSQYQREYLSSLVVLLALRVYRHERAGVSVEQDEETGRYVVKYADGDGPEWEPLPDGVLDDPTLDEGVEDAFPEDHEQ
jgi:hypothetical protein